MKRESAETIHCIEIAGISDRHAAEALYLEMRRLARRYGIDIKEIRIEKEATHSPA